MRVERAPSGVQTLTNLFGMIFFNFRIFPAKLSRGAKQHPSNSAHLMRRFVWGCRYMFTNSSFLLTSEPNSRRMPRVGRVWLAQPYTQAFQTPPSTWSVPNGQVGPHLSQSHLHVYSVQCLSKPASYAFLLPCFPITSPVPTAWTSVLYSQ
jgi:hypothetical protein